MFKYNYVFFNATDNRLKITPNGYNTICTMDLERTGEIVVVSYPLDYAPEFIKKLFRLHRSPKLNKFFKVPFKNAWFPLYFPNRFKNNKPYCFIMSGSYITLEYINYLKKKYPTAKFVKIHRDLIKFIDVQNPNMAKINMDEVFDLRMSFDKGDSKKYNILHFNEFESKINVPIDDNYPLYDVFFAGTAKERLPRLMEIYHKLTDAGLKCHYYLFKVPKEQRIPYEGIEYGDTYLPYDEMLFRTVNSKCVLDVNQDGADGYTSRFLEAVMYNKKLLTDNFSIKNSKFYDERFIRCFKDTDDISIDFVKSNIDVDYCYNNEFSPLRLIEQIEEELDKL